jgi:hypothetical protein
LIDNYETSVGATEADYVDVHFKLRAPEPAPSNVHIWGEFMNWTPSQETLLNYDEASQSYNGTYLMKQGFYNYMYVLEAKAGEKATKLILKALITTLKTITKLSSIPAP